MCTRCMVCWCTRACCVGLVAVFRKEPVRFGSVRFGKCHFPVRRGSACVFRTRRGSVRFGSVRRPEAEAGPFGEFRGVVARKADAFGYPFQPAHFSLPVSGPPTSALRRLVAGAEALQAGEGRAAPSSLRCHSPSDPPILEGGFEPE